jgi:transcriptional regulator with XRE-family HTH domain
MERSLGAKIKGLRVAKELLPSQLAERVPVDKSTLLDYENGTSEPTFGKLKALAAALEVRAGYFFDELPEYKRMPAKRVAASEALRLFFLKHGPAENEQHPYRKLLSVPDVAPKTVAEWELYHRRDRLVHENT